MTTRFSIGLALFCFTLCSAVSAADFRPLDVKTGQWEATVTGQTTGMPPIPEEALKQLTPEQRAKMEAAMQARGVGGAKTTVSKSCLTQADLDKPFNMGDDSTKSCTRTMLTSTGRGQEIHIVCDRQGMKSSGTIKVETIDSENVKGSMQMTMTTGDHTMNMNYTFTTKWIGPACTQK